MLTIVIGYAVFAETVIPDWAAALGALGTLITVVIGAYATLRKTTHGNAMEAADRAAAAKTASDNVALSAAYGLLDRMKKDFDEMKAETNRKMKEQEDRLREKENEHDKCMEERRELSVTIGRLETRTGYLEDALRRQNIPFKEWSVDDDTGPHPALAERRKGADPGYKGPPRRSSDKKKGAGEEP